MNLELINNLVNDAKNNKLVQDFIEELSNYLLSKAEGKENTQMQETNNGVLREEDCLYQVVDKGINGVFLQNTKNNKIFLEKNIPPELQDEIETDFVLRYKNGEYIIEEGLTDDFFNSMVGIKEYKDIQEKFIEETNISELDPNTKFFVQYREKEYTVLSYENVGEKEIEVPNALLPFFMDNDTVLCYKDGKFEKI